MQTFLPRIIRQIAKFWLYRNIAKCNYLGMEHSTLRRRGGMTSRPWLMRLPGECAFPVAGEGVGLRSCCRPSGDDRYCAAHAARMRSPSMTPAADFEREILRFLEQGL